jgi:hypothetical protein
MTVTATASRTTRGRDAGTPLCIGRRFGASNIVIAALVRRLESAWIFFCFIQSANPPSWTGARAGAIQSTRAAIAKTLRPTASMNRKRPEAVVGSMSLSIGPMLRQVNARHVQD